MGKTSRQEDLKKEVQESRKTLHIQSHAVAMLRYAFPLIQVRILIVELLLFAF